MSAMYGADVAELRRIAAEFDSVANEIDEQAGVLSRFLNNISWLGDIAINFTNQWTGTNIRTIGLSTRFLHDAAASLRAQADEQEAASGQSSGSRSSGSGGVGPGGLRVAPNVGGDQRGNFNPQGPTVNPQDQRPATGAPSDGPAAASPGAEEPLPGHGRTREQVIAAYDINWKTWEEKGLLGRAGAPDGPESLRYQCTAWMWYRLRELGYDGKQISQGSLDHPAYEESVFGATRDTVPLPGAIVARSGHVMIAEEVYIDESGRRAMRVSEMNHDSVPETGLPSEYRDTEVWVEDPETGTWRNDRTGRTFDFSIANVERGTPRI